MLATAVHDTIAAVPTAVWDALGPGGHVDRGHAYLAFREHVEPGLPTVITADDAHGPAAAAHGCLSTPRSALLSHPWKMLTASQFLRLERGDPGAAEAEREHGRLLDALGGRTAADLTAALGEAIVFRGFDSSEILLRPGLDGAQRDAALVSVVDRARELVERGRAGAVVLPFVRPEDTALRDVLRIRGFRHATLTGISVLDLSPFRGYHELLASFRTGRRSRYRNEERALAGSGLALGTVDLAGHAGRVAELEAQTARKYGGSPDPAGLADTRRTMARMLGSSVRVPVATRDGDIVACGVHLVDRHSYLSLTYGCDYAADRGTAYQCINFYDPLRHAFSRNLRQLRCGFEAFAPKLLRGARLVRRETWIWTPRGDRLDAVGEVLRLLGRRTAEHFTELDAGRH